MRKALLPSDAPPAPDRSPLPRAARRPAAWLSPFMLCLFGMTAGMAIDYHRTRFLILDFCTGNGGLSEAIERHVGAMPNMYLGVALAAAIGLCREVGLAWTGDRTGKALGRALACTGLMLAGMLAASLAAMRLTGSIHPLGEWLAMTVGMLGGHAIGAGRRAVDG
ncbi:MULTISPECIES: hypothetical protein [unclassified Sphingomonas]|uniref:hypothetical protein n=2 Tax=Sphingomonas TaxID=13687 RepID=UPI0012E3DC0E|nr:MULTISPECIES: hypothetical protein [unclassified Sphingomonas]